MGESSILSLISKNYLLKISTKNKSILKNKASAAHLELKVALPLDDHFRNKVSHSTFF